MTGTRMSGSWPRSRKTCQAMAPKGYDAQRGSKRGVASVQAAGGRQAEVRDGDTRTQDQRRGGLRQIGSKTRTQRA